MVFRVPRPRTTSEAGGDESAGVGTPARPDAAAEAQSYLDLLPVPAVVVALDDDQLSFVATNSSFVQAGFGRTSARSPVAAQLKSRIAAFLRSTREAEAFSWQNGDAVDCRHYHVHMARRAGTRSRCMLTFVDQTSELRTEQNLRREMLTDSLSGLPNRAGFSDRLEDTIVDQASRADFAVLIVNLDRFSRVNACLGSLAGDELLITVARRLKGALRARDVLARTGGDEFGILLALDEGRGDAVRVAKRIQAALATPFRLSDFEIRVSCSIGIAFGADTIGDSEDLIRHAQFAVKRSKATGSVECYQTQAFDIARQQFGLETALRRAIDGDQLRLAYQPICDLATGRIVAFEALARWRNEAGVELSPIDFIPVAEESGLIIPLGRWALAEAAATLSGWDKRAGGDCGVRFAVNVSAIQLQRDDIAQAVGNVLSHSGLSGDRLTVELTESALIADPDRATRTMEALKGLGTTIAMDDFGTGYSNLAYLQKLPIDVLKMDRSFVTGMLADRDKIAIVRAILGLAQALGMGTTAEGVETNELAQTLAALGCTFGQGFLYAAPLEADAAYQLLVDRNA